MCDGQSKKTSLFSWGSGLQGQLGLGNEMNALPTPNEVVDLQDHNISFLTASGDVSAVITEEGSIFTWGKTKGGSLGSTGGSTMTTNLLSPTPIEAMDVRFKTMSCGRTHMAAITENGKLITWGNPDYGKLGHPSKEQEQKTGYKPRNYAEYADIDFVQGLDDKPVMQVACGFQHTACLTTSGDVYTWGNGKLGALGHGDWTPISTPKKVEGISNVKKIDCGGDFIVILDKDGKLFSWGQNRYGQLGIIGTNTFKQNKPAKINLPPSVKVVDFSCGEDHSAILTETGEIFTWGYGNDGQLGHKDRTNLNSPKKLQFGEKIKKVVCGGGHTGILTEKSELYLFGRGRDGQLGRGDSLESMASYRTEPKRVDAVDNKVVDMALGNNHTLALTLKL